MTRQKIKIPLILVFALVLGLAIFVFFQLPKPVTAHDAAFDLLQLADGTYPGRCDNGLVKAAVEVVVQDHQIAQVRLVAHDHGLGSAAEAILDTVVQEQSVEVDAVSGATLSSKTILMAVETALSEGRKTT